MTSEPEGLADLGLWQDAWDAIEALPPDQRASPAALRVRLRCCPALGAWDIGQHVAALLRDGGTADKELAGQFYHHLAIYHARAGHQAATKQAIRSACGTWPDVRLAMIEDPELGSIIFGE